MMNKHDAAVITGRDDLIASIAQGEKPPAQWKIGVEHEKFVFHKASLRRLGYDTAPGIRDLLQALSDTDWTPSYEAGNVIGLRHVSGASMTLEPGGQFELSGAPLETLHQTCSEINAHIFAVKRACEAMGAGIIGLGFDPISRREDILWMPKARYDIMRAYMPQKGHLGLDMMGRTCTVQVNLDFASEADMIKKMRVSMALQPLATALFANSPLYEGALNGYKSTRSLCWTDTDPDRCGLLPFVFDSSFGYERWVDYVLDVPMYFLNDATRYLDVAGLSFRDFLQGNLPHHKGRLPSIDDWNDHMTTVFPEVRLKSFIEMRGADSGHWQNLCALPALWVGLLYDAEALAAAYDLIKPWSIAQIAHMRDTVPKAALKAASPHGTMQDLAKIVMAIAEQGLKNRRRGGQIATDETEYLQYLHEISESGRTGADVIIEKFQGSWGGDARKIFAEMAY